MTTLLSLALALPVALVVCVRRTDLVRWRNELACPSCKDLICACPRL